MILVTRTFDVAPALHALLLYNLHVTTGRGAVVAVDQGFIRHMFLISVAVVKTIRLVFFPPAKQITDGSWPVQPWRDNGLGISFVLLVAAMTSWDGHWVGASVRLLVTAAVEAHRGQEERLSQLLREEEGSSVFLNLGRECLRDRHLVRHELGKSSRLMPRDKKAYAVGFCRRILLAALLLPLLLDLSLLAAEGYLPGVGLRPIRLTPLNFNTVRRPVGGSMELRSSTAAEEAKGEEGGVVSSMPRIGSYQGTPNTSTIVSSLIATTILFFRFVVKLSTVDSIYYVLTTLSTLGFGDLSLVTKTSRLVWPGERVRRAQGGSGVCEKLVSYDSLRSLQFAS